MSTNKSEHTAEIVCDVYAHEANEKTQVEEDPEAVSAVIHRPESEGCNAAVCGFVDLATLAARVTETTSIAASGAPNCGDPDPTVPTLIQNARACLDRGQLDEAEESLGQARQALAQLGDGGGDTLQQVVDMPPDRLRTDISYLSELDALITLAESAHEAHLSLQKYELLVKRSYQMLAQRCPAWAKRALLTGGGSTYLEPLSATFRSADSVQRRIPVLFASERTLETWISTLETCASSRPERPLSDHRDSESTAKAVEQKIKRIQETAALLSPGQAQEALVTARSILSTLQQHQRMCAPAASGGAGKGDAERFAIEV